MFCRFCVCVVSEIKKNFRNFSLWEIFRFVFGTFPKMMLYLTNSDKLFFSCHWSLEFLLKIRTIFDFSKKNKIKCKVFFLFSIIYWSQICRCRFLIELSISLRNFSSFFAFHTSLHCTFFIIIEKRRNF